MAIREITIKESKGAFSIFKKSSVEKEQYDFSDISALRQLLNNEKARLLNAIKTEKPSSLYDLAKKVNRNFKSVHDDVKLLERFGFLHIKEEKVNNRTRHIPHIVTDTLTIHLKL